MTRLANLIDGGYLARVTQEMGFPFIQFSALAEKMAAGSAVYGNYYYDCLPFLGKSSTQDDRGYFHRKRRFFTKLGNLPRFQVRLGQLQFQGYHPDGRPRVQQKQVDVFVAVDLTILSTKHLITDAALFAGDSDFIPAVEAAQAEGVHVHLFHGRGAHADLIRVCNSATKITSDFAKAVARSAQPLVPTYCAMA